MPLLIERFRVTAKQSIAFDQEFSAGVNVVEGENSSGKSTLFKLIYFGLGGALTPKQWTRAALHCDRVYLQARIGINSVTISRKIAETGLPSTLIFDGTMAEALASPIEQWKEFPYSRSADRQSYSQLMFSLLGMPEAFADSGDFLTFNQFLRVHYADQDSPAASLLRFEDQFDKPSTREAIGSFVLGGTDQNLARLEQALREAQGKYSNSLASVAAGNILLGSDYNELSASGLDAAEDRTASEIQATEERVRALATGLLRPIQASDIDQTYISALSQQLSEAKSELGDRLAARSELDLEARDSELFLTTLRRRVEYLTQSLRTADTLGDVQLDSCPACGSAVDPSQDQEHCYLCKSDASRERPTARYLSLLNATQTQIEQSTKIQATRLSHIKKLDEEIRAFHAEIDRVARDLQGQRATVSTKGQAELSSLQTRLGYLNGELERIRRDKRVVERLDALRSDRDRLSAEITRTREEIERIRNGAALRLGGAYSAVASEAEEFLKADMDRQAEFHDDPHVEIDFRGNSFSINGHKSFSASSVSYLRNSVFLGILFAADRIESMRHLRLLLLENLEDKGMEPERYHRLHRTIVARSSELERPFQLLIATADLDPSIREQVHLVGRRYTHDAKTLAVVVDDDENDTPEPS